MSTSNLSAFYEHFYFIEWKIISFLTFSFFSDFSAVLLVSLLSNYFSAPLLQLTNKLECFPRESIFLPHTAFVGKVGAYPSGVPTWGRMSESRSFLQSFLVGRLSLSNLISKAIWLVL